MTSTIGVDNVVPVYPSGNQAALMLKNVGTVTLYLGSTAAVNATGYPLGVGSSIIWDAGRPLYAYAVNGLLLVSENTGALFDAQAVASEIIAAGLAQDIADKIAIGGAPPINKYTLLATYSDTLPVYPTAFSQYFSDLNYNTLTIAISETIASGLTPFTLGQVSIIPGTYGGVPLEYKTTGNTVIQIPLSGGAAQVDYFGINQPGTRFLRIYGSYETLARPIVKHDAFIGSPVGTSSIVIQSPQQFAMEILGQNTTARRLQIPSRPGRVQMTIDIPGSSVAGNTWRIQNAISPPTIYQWVATNVSASLFTTELIFGDQPIIFYSQLASGNTGYTVNFNYL